MKQGYLVFLLFLLDKIHSYNFQILEPFFKKVLKSDTITKIIKKGKHCGQRYYSRPCKMAKT